MESIYSDGEDKNMTQLKIAISKRQTNQNQACD